jgi:seryl-tRNA synthetase
MHDLSYFRADFNRTAQRLATRGAVAGLETFRELDQKRRAVVTEREARKSRVNIDSTEIGKLKSQGADTTERQERHAFSKGVCP